MISARSTLPPRKSRCKATGTPKSWSECGTESRRRKPFLPCSERFSASLDFNGFQTSPGRHPEPPRTATRCSGQLLVSSGGPHSRWPRSAQFLSRAGNFFEVLLADRFTRHVSIRVMEHASSLDLVSYEDSGFYDKLERARLQATDRIAMIQAFGTAVQQVTIGFSLAAGIFWYSPWLIVLLILAVTPAFLGESHFAFLGYSLNISQTPIRLAAGSTICASWERARNFRQGVETVWAKQLPGWRILSAFRRDLRPERSACPPPSRDRCAAVFAQHGRDLRGVRLHHLPDRHGRFELGQLAVSGRCDRRRQRQHRRNICDILPDRGSVVVPRESRRFLFRQAKDCVETRRNSLRRDHSRVVSFSRT